MSKDGIAVFFRQINWKQKTNSIRELKDKWSIGYFYVLQNGHEGEVSKIPVQFHK